MTSLSLKLVSRYPASNFVPKCDMLFHESGNAVFTWKVQFFCLISRSQFT